MVVPSRKEAERREQAKRDINEALSRREQAGWSEVRDRHKAGTARHACPESEGRAEASEPRRPSDGLERRAKPRAGIARPGLP